MQRFRVRDGNTGKVTEQELDLDALRRKAESAGGDPIRRLSHLICERLTSQGAVVDDSHHRQLYHDLSRAFATEDWPRAFDLSNGSGNRQSRRELQDEKNSMGDQDAPESVGVFEKETIFPDEEARTTYENLVGLDAVKEHLLREATLLAQPARLEDWSRNHHDTVLTACHDLRSRMQFVVFAGDVGTGKTALAETFGDALARELGTSALLLRLSVQARGSGLVGEMTSLIFSAFDLALVRAASFEGITILLLDEADALASSRETQQMHHEDRAGVNALIQGVDRIAAGDYPVLVVFCTNRPGSLDPAMRRRAADIFEFTRPTDMQRRALFDLLLDDLGLGRAVLGELVDLTGPAKDRRYGFTFSDIRTRLVPNAVREAFGTDLPLTGELLLEHARAIEPTPPFTDQGS